MYQPKHLKLWKHPECYIGATWEDYYSVIGMHRDSPLLDVHNFGEVKTALEAKIAEIGATHVNEGQDNEQPFLINPYESHWAVSHIEWLGLHKDSPESLLQLADELLDKLADYPILNEESFSEKEWDAANETWASLPLQERVELCQKYHICIFAARHDCIPQADTGGIFEYCRPE
jgi:hypothetical protein